jgi:uncharacterized protein
MKLTLDYGSSVNYIHQYDVGLIKVNDTLIKGNVVILPETIVENWTPTDVGSITIEDFGPVIAFGPEIILLGTGRRQAFPALEVMARMSSQGVGFEVMDTAAACRTYNVLMSESRRVAAALLMIR